MTITGPGNLIRSYAAAAINQIDQTLSACVEGGGFFDLIPYAAQGRVSRRFGQANPIGLPSPRIGGQTLR